MQLARERRHHAPLDERWDAAELLSLSRFCCTAQVASWANREDVGNMVCGGAGRLLRAEAEAVRHGSRAQRRRALGYSSKLQS